MIEEEQTAKKSSLDSLDQLLADVVSGSSTDSPLKQQLEEKNEDIKKRWQQLVNTLEIKQEVLIEALRLAEKYEENKTKIEQWMKEANTKMYEIVPFNLQRRRKELEKMMVIMYFLYTTCCDTADTLSTKTTDPTVTKALNTSIQQHKLEWQQLRKQLVKTSAALKAVNDKVHDLKKCVTEVSDWLNETLFKLNSLDSCATRVNLIDNQISEAKVCVCGNCVMCVDCMYYQATLEEITSKGDSIQVVQNIGQEVMSQCSPQDKDVVQQKLNVITTNFADVEDMAKLHLKDLNEERVKAEDYEKQGSELDDWLKFMEKKAINENLTIRSVTLEVQIRKIRVCQLIVFKLEFLAYPYCCEESNAIWSKI